MSALRGWVVGLGCKEGLSMDRGSSLVWWGYSDEEGVSSRHLLPMAW